MANKKVKCRYCGELIDRDLAYKVGKANYYCNEEHYISKQDDNSKDIKCKPQDGSDRRKLTDYIQQVYLDCGYNKNDINWNLLMQQVKLMQDKYGYKYSGILLTLKYMKEIKGMDLIDKTTNSCLNLIEYYYNETKQSFIDKRKIEQALEDFEFKDEIKIMKKGVDKNIHKWYNEIEIENIK